MLLFGLPPAVVFGKLVLMLLYLVAHSHWDQRSWGNTPARVDPGQDWRLSQQGGHLQGNKDCKDDMKHKTNSNYMAVVRGCTFSAHQIIYHS